MVFSQAVQTDAGAVEDLNSIDSLIRQIQRELYDYIHLMLRDKCLLHPDCQRVMNSRSSVITIEFLPPDGL